MKEGNNNRARRPFVTPLSCVCVRLSSASWFDGWRFGSLSPPSSPVQLQCCTLLPPPPCSDELSTTKHTHTVAFPSVSSSSSFFSYNSVVQFVSFLYSCVYFHDRIRNGKFQITRSLIFSHCLYTKRDTRGTPPTPPLHISSLLPSSSTLLCTGTTVTTEYCEYPYW